MNKVDVVNNEAAQRFEVTIDGQVAVSEYRLSNGQIIFTHTEVPEALEGQGIAGQLVKVGLEHARENGLRVVPMCPFVTSYIRRHPEYQSLVTHGVG